MSEGLNPDRDLIRFLEWLRPHDTGFPGVALTVIPVGGGRTTTATSFDAKAGAGWATQFRGKQNCYYMVNPPRGALTKKAAKPEVAALAFLHVDIDPKKGEDWQEERERILGSLEAFSPRPSAVIDSGNGYQALWRLRDPIPINGEAHWTELETYNRQLAADLDGDSTHDVSRILRLPGLINLPDEKKRKRGRVERATATVWLEDSAYILGDDFTPAPPEKGRTAAGAAVELPGELPTIDLDDLPAAVTPRTRMLIVQGDDPDDPTKYGSKSEVMWAVVCEMVRADCSNELIAAVLLDPDFGISDHPLRQRHPIEYVARQIERAREDNDAGGRRVLDPKAPFRTAMRLHEELFPDAIHTNQDWLKYERGAYRYVEDATMRSTLYCALEEAVVRKVIEKKTTYLPFNQNRESVGGVLDALEGLAHQPADGMAPPVWLDGSGPPPLEIVALRNGLLHVPSGELLPATPRFFTRNALDIDFAADSPPAVEWLRFVEQVFPDPAAAALLQDWFGYLLLPDTSLQKIMLLVGPTRSGKGVIQHVITALVGAGNVCAPSPNSLGGTNVGALQPLIGSTVAFLTDARFGGRSDKVAITANLLAISAGDPMTIDRKHKAAWTGRLATRLIVMSNELPGLRDNSPALANRFTPLILEHSFLGREDPGLAARIIANELPGVLVWALDGWRRLRGRGHFALPVASEEAIAEILDLGSPVAAFVNARCELGESSSVEKERLYRAYRTWCEATEQHAVAPNVFGRDLGTATGGKVRPGKTRVGAADGGRVTVYLGVELRDRPGPEPGPPALPFDPDAQLAREPY